MEDLSIKILDGRDHFYQWDTGRKLVITGLNAGDELHFTQTWLSTHTLKTYEKDGAILCDVPDELLQRNEKIGVYVYCVGLDGCCTMREAEFEVRSRPKPIDYVYSKTETYTVEQAVAAALKEAKATGMFDGKDADYSLVANAIKNISRGSVLRLEDVSPMEHELKVRVEGENLAVDIAAGGNATFENGVATQIVADTYEIIYTKAQVYQGSTFISGADALTLTSTGRRSMQFTRPAKGDTLVFGINGQTLDTTVRIDISDLPEGVYTVSADFTSITQGSISWRDIMLNRGATAKPYTPPVSDLAAGNSLRVYRKNLFATLDTLHKPPLSVVGVTISQEEDGTLIFNGTSTNASGFYVPLNLPKGDYTVSFKNDKTAGSSAGTSNSLYGVLRSGTKWLRTVYFNTENVKATLLKNDNWQDVDIITDALFGFPAGITFDNFKIKPQLEIGSSETEYEPYIKPTIYPVKADGMVDGVVSLSPVMSLFTDTKGVLIECEYNRDANAFINNLVERVIALENFVLNS